MSGAVLTPFSSGRLEGGFSRIQSGLGRIIGVQNEMEKIKRNLRHISGFTVIAEQVAREDQKLMKLLEKLKDVHYDAEDLLEEFEIEEWRRAAEKKNIMPLRDIVTNKVRKVVTSLFNTGGPNLRLKSLELSNKLEKIIAECHESQLKELVTKWKNELKGNRDTISTVDPSGVFGRDNEINEIVDWLVPTEDTVMVGDGGGNNKNVQAISILGMGGQGKTTLAQMVFDHRKVDLHFSLKIWMCVLDGFDVTTLANEIIERATESNPNLQRRERLHDRLKNALRGKKFLLVLDDVWDARCDEWLKLKGILMCGDRGSRIVVTTRSRRVADITSEIEPHILKDLSDEACWSLFSLRAFGSLNRGEEKHQNLVTIGKEIVKKCKGNPLAVTTLADLLVSERRENKWKCFRDGEMCDIARKDGYGILSALRLSYDNLKPHVKQCFAFCAVFPKDYEIDKEYLIKLWMANGFIPPQQGKELEEIGDDIFHELSINSFFEDKDVNIREPEFPPPDLFSNNKKTTFRIHSHMHDLAKLVMWEECCIAGQGKSVNISKRVRHISLEIPIASLPETQTLRSYIKLKCESPFSCDIEIFKYFNLRAVDLRQHRRPLPPSLDKLQHLRYLDLSYASIERLPESLTHLHYLQTLILRSCGNLCELPKEIVNLTSLRCLDVTDCSRLTHMPVKMGQLSCLRELNLFIVGRSDQFACSGIGELQSLNLKGHLSIEHLENVTDVNDVHQANLIEKSNLTSLSLGWARDPSHSEGLGQTEQEMVLEGFKPHQNLELLKIFGYGGVSFSSWMTDTASTKLVRIYLSQCCRCNQLPPLGQLPCLEVLGINGLKNVESIGDEFYGNDMSQGFRSLKTLEITEMEKLTTCSGIGFPQLVNMNIDSCPRLTTVRHFSSSQGMMHTLRSLKSLKISSCSQLGNFPIRLHNLVSLETLSVNSCDRLFSLSFGLHYFSPLRSLEIVNSSNFMRVANELSFLTCLQDLTLNACHGLTSLPEGIGTLTSLNFLSISHCSEMESLPNALQGLTALKRLNIQGCPTLNERCKKDIGKDWHKIQHIPHIICRE
ncbi:putative disease resistance protein RGA1 [Cinnamomum micranthum f. kanehirae]|uniref:Putative disease resistance protein RGA1 n=1 Tax=Cinnamomum micranthum f. kanehirae TaxID=337451 RepID=A0A3S3MG45_9MAGN|nr:putative disease resistance protein RGA1 [Cinnamomum micranthum f. kanehirae]